MPILQQQEFDAMRTGAQVLEEDQHGMKVLRLADGSILKLFRVKRFWSSAQLIPYSSRFCRNALRLERLGIPTVSVKACYQLPLPDRTAVHYEPLPGLTLRQLAASKGLDDNVLGQLGRFIALLHDRGIYFRSLHLGNIVYTPEGKLGLIDIADLGVYSRLLNQNKRIRNFRHLTRLKIDRDYLGQAGWRTVIREYCEAANLNEASIQYLTARVGRSE